MFCLLPAVCERVPYRLSADILVYHQLHPSFPHYDLELEEVKV
jgi:hypothetical protein